jgi:DNA-binding GntR family transcriptional regulator
MLLQLGAQPGGPPADLEPSGKDAGGPGAAVHALLHHGPDVQQSGADLRLAAPGQLVGQHDVADPQPRLARPGQQLLAGAERIPHRRGVLDDGRVAGVVLVEDEPAAHRVVLASADFLPFRVQRPEEHAVAVELQPLPPVEDDVVVHGEGDEVLARQPELAFGTNGSDAGFGRHRVDEVGLLAFEAQHDRLDAAVPVPGRPERPEELAADAGHLRQQRFVAEPGREGAGGPHGSDGVRAGGADTHLEQVEGADGHACPSQRGRRPRLGTHLIYQLDGNSMPFPPRRQALTTVSTYDSAVTAVPLDPDPSAVASLAEKAYVAIRDRLIMLAISPGDPLDDDALAQDLGVGRTPVREALKRLEVDRLVVSYPRRGTFATGMDISDLAHISEIRAQLEPLAARRAAERASRSGQAELEELARRIEHLDVTQIDRTELMRWDLAVHRAIYRAAGNPHLEDVLIRYDNLATRIFCLFLDRLPTVDEHVGEHVDLLRAIAAGDADRADDLARDHVLGFEQAIRAVI